MPVIPALPHTSSAGEVIRSLDSSAQGLGSAETLERLESYGPNEIPESRKASIALLVFKQFKSWLVIILIIAAIISWLAGQTIDAWVILLVILINAVIGFSQEYRAENAITTLRKMSVRTAKVFRNKTLIKITATGLVPGDVIVLEEGDSVPADGRIIGSKNLRTIEAPLTGESVPVAKKEEPLPAETPMAEQKNMVWKDTFVAAGYATVIVTGTGTATAIGSISESLRSIRERRSNFMKKTDVLARQMSVIAFASAILLFLVGFFIRKLDLDDILLTSIAALVAAVPEGLPAVISIVLALGARRMAKKNAIIREFTATETLGAVTAILTDKTGTLTQNTLTVRKVFLPGEPEILITGEGWFPAGNFIQDDSILEITDHSRLRKLLDIAALSNNSEVKYNTGKNSYELIGDPTEGALFVLARKGGVQPERLHIRKLDDLPFSSVIKMRATLVREKQQREIFVTGAPEVLLEQSTAILTAEGERPITANELTEIRHLISHWSDHAMRVIALAYKPASNDKEKIDESELNGLVFAGVVGMIDPPRPDTRDAVLKCKKAGIRIIMVTGDHVNTAVAIARETGIITSSDENQPVALTEKQLNDLKPEEFDEALRKISVFARLTPDMKLRIARRFQAMGHLIAMTGDGVNDAPALKQADVGISMGIMGTDVARDASDMILADDNFSTIVKAVEEGRIVFKNARQTSFFLVTTNIAESVTLLMTLLLGMPLPLTATQILWLNLVTDGVTDIALATEVSHGDIMNSKPMKKEENILNRKVLPFLLINIVLMTGISLFAFHYYLEESIEKARTAVFIVMAFSQLFNVFNLRDLEKPLLTIGPFSNRYINMGVGISVLLLILITEVSPIASVFRFIPLLPADYLILFLLSSSILFVVESYKYMMKRFTRPA